METMASYVHGDGRSSELDASWITQLLLSPRGIGDAPVDAEFLAEATGSSTEATVSDMAPKYDSKDRKRTRNREWMRRARLQKRAQANSVQNIVAALETQRSTLMREKNLSEAAVEDLVQQRHDTQTKITKYRELNSSYTHAAKTVGSLREENFTLREELRRRRVAAKIIEELVLEVRQSISSHSRYNITDSPHSDSSIEFQWLDEIESFYRPIPDDKVLDLVRESYDEVMHYVQVAESCLPSAHQVFGWTDRRFLHGSWSNFMFEKAFPHKTPSELSDKTWQMSIDAVRVKVLQPRAQRMKVLQELNENTLVVARQSYFPNEDTNLCSVYVLFRIATEDGGFAIGSRSIEPYDATAIAPYKANGRHLFSKLVYTFQFRPLAREAGVEHSSTTRGCHVTFGGRVDNVRTNHAANCLMDAILAMLRWETHCVAPVLTLCPSSGAQSDEGPRGPDPIETLDPEFRDEAPPGLQF